MDPGKALIASLEIIKALYETAETYRKLERINRETLNEIALLIHLQEHIKNCRRIENNVIIDNYLLDINKRLVKFKNLIEKVDEGSFFGKIIYTKKVKKVSLEIAELIRKLKFLLDIKKELSQSGKLDVANIISDPEGRKFWDTNFGSEHTYVQENLFFSALRMNTKYLSKEIDFLKKVINGDSDKYITAFEFQEWLHFFGQFNVAMQRTIDSLFDPNTYDIVNWYHQNVSKNLVSALLVDNLFIVRKHSNQCGVFIVNFRFNGEICNLFIRNKDDEFRLEKVDGMNVIELMFYENVDRKKSNNLKEILECLGILLGVKKVDGDWGEGRKGLEDVEVRSEKESGIINGARGLVENIGASFGKIGDGVEEMVENMGGLFWCFHKS